MIIGFVGLGHLGLISSIVATSKSCKVIAYGNKSELSKIEDKKININEPKLSQLYKKNKKKIKFTNKLNDLKRTDFIYISKDVPTDSKNISNLKPITNIIKSLYLFKKKPTIIILSQVPPGFMRNIKWPLNKLYYQAETLIFGMAIERALKPERIIVGNFSGEAKIDNKLKKYLRLFNCPILIMNYESAELTKISINMYLISSITTTNLLSELSNKVGANWPDISSALKLDRRIGKYAYLKPGLGISGGNLERDLNTVIRTCNRYNLDINIFNMWKKKSNYFKNWAIKKFLELRKNKKYIKKIAVLGLAYKPNTDSLKNSPSIEIVNKLKNKYSVNVYDPVIKKIEKNNLNFSNSLYNAVKNVNLIFIMTPWKEFRNLNSIKIKKILKGKIIIDPFGLIRGQGLLNNKVKYFSIETDHRY